MVTVRLLRSMAGPAGAWTAGDLYTCDPALAARLVAVGTAEALEAPAATTGELETATATPKAERAEGLGRRGRKAGGA